MSNPQNQQNINSPQAGEGDLNSSPRRRDWQAEHINTEAREILDRDTQYFLHQSISTPGLNTIRKA